MKLVQSSIGTKWRESIAGDGSGHIICTFPDFVTGRFEIFVIKAASSAMTFQDVNTRGNVTVVEDIWHADHYKSHVSLGTSGNRAGVVAHVDVKPAVAGIDNEAEITFNGNDATEATIYVRPYNPDLELKWQKVSDGTSVVPS